MAPRGTKRAATAGDSCGSAKKRAKPVVATLLAEGRSECNMIAATLEFSLCVYKELRNPMQAEVVDMCASSLSAIELAKATLVKDAEGLCANVENEKATRKQAAAAAEAALVGLKADVEAKAAEEKAAAEACKQAEAELKAATDAQKAGDKEFKALDAKKAKLEKAFAEIYAPLKDGQSVKNHKASMKKLMAVGKEFGFDASLLESAPAVIERTPPARGEFDKIILDKMEAECKKNVDELTAQLQALEPAKAERAAKVSAAQGACDAAAAKEEAAKAALKEAKENLKAGEKALKAANDKVKNWLSDVKKMFEALDAAKADLAEFKDGPLNIFTELKEMETPPPPAPEPEPVAEEAPAAESTPAEAAPAPAETVAA